MATIADTVDWREARQWLIDSGVIPPTHRVTKPDVNLIDFARSLRDGVFLCSLLNCLREGCVEYTARPVMQHSYLSNINSFLTACKISFNIRENDLFTDSELYDVDNFSKVMSALSKLSYTQEALSMGWKPFPSEDNKDQFSNDVSGDDIYASLQDVSAQTAVYANIQDLYQESPSDDDSFGYGDEKIYDSIVYYQKPPVPENDQDEKKKSTLQELYETEKHFVNVLEIISKDYYEALKDQPGLDDLRDVFMISQKLLPCHIYLREGLGKCAEGKGDADIAQYFFEVEEGLLEYGLYAAYIPEAQEKAKMFQNRGETSKMMQSIMERNNQRFPLGDLLPIPIQRIVRYPLLVKELEKCCRKSAMPSQRVLQQLDKLKTLLEDIAKYINVTKEHFEKMRAIQELEANISEYRGPKISSQCGHYHMDGELRMKVIDGKDRDEPKSRWVFLFDKILLITARKYKFTKGTSYSVKAYHDIADITLVDPIVSVKTKSSPYSFKIRVEGKDGKETCEYIAFAKTDQLKFKWRDSINKAREVISPKAGKKGHHTFELVNFDSPKRCQACHKYLYGCYFQGYECSECHVISHAECLCNLSSCVAVRPRRPPHTTAHSPLREQQSVDSVFPRFHPKRGTINGTEQQRKVYVASQRYNAIGPRRDTFLSFERGDEISITKDSDQEWWEGVLVKNGQRGLVSPNYLVKKTTVVGDPTLTDLDITRKRLSQYGWYIGMKTRIDAEVALHRLRDGVFLIRESMDRPGEYAVALKWNNMPKHIKIMKNPQTDRFYVSDACDFESIDDLVKYYQKNTLGVSFPGVDTTLKFPYQDVIIGFERRHHSVSAPPPPPNFPAPHPQNQQTPLVSPPPYGGDGNWVEAVCEFEGEGPGHLSFKKHDRIKVLTKDTQKLGWWFGECNGKTGYFPSDYTYKIPNAK